MPEAAIAATAADAVLKVEEMAKFLYGLCCVAARPAERPRSGLSATADQGRGSRGNREVPPRSWSRTT
jgi:hypothetical protein